MTQLVGVSTCPVHTFGLCCSETLLTIKNVKVKTIQPVLKFPVNVQHLTKHKRRKTIYNRITGACILL